MSKFKLPFELEQQTPMIHFQSDEPGACLRGSDVKPKLDRFIKKYLEIKNRKIREENKKNNSLLKEILDTEWLIDRKKKDEEEKSEAYDYKIKIIANEDKCKQSNSRNVKIEKKDDTWKIKDNHKINGMYFGNKVSETILNECSSKEKVQNEVQKKYVETVFYENGALKLIVICFIESLSELIEEVIELFFMIHNFGMRQTKGFGSFTLKKKDSQKKELKNRLKISDFYPVYYEVEYKNIRESTSKNQLNDIKLIYELMRSGINLKNKDKNIKDYFKGFIFQYTLNKNIDENDKKFIKTKVLKIIPEKKELEYRLVRIFLGLTSEMSFFKKNDNTFIEPSKRRIKIEDEKEEIKRFSSPVYFTVHGNKIYIFPKEIPQIIYNRKFKINNNEITTLTEFDLVDFLNQFMEYFNKNDEYCDSYNKNRKNGKSMQKLSGAKNYKIKETVNRNLQIEKKENGKRV